MQVDEENLFSWKLGLMVVNPESVLTPSSVPVLARTRADTQAPHNRCASVPVRQDSGRPATR